MTTYSQPGIINALDYGLVANSTADATANTTNLINAINAAQASCGSGGSGTSLYGGIVIIPSNDNGDDGSVYYFANPQPTTVAITITCNYPIMILGTGGATKLVMTQGVDFFEVNNVMTGESGVSGGVTFQDLQISYKAGLTSGAAIRVSNGSQNVRLLRVVLVDCPVGVAFDNSLQCSMINCIVWNEENGGNAVTLGTTTSGDTAMETYIADCILEAASPNNAVGTALTIVNVDEVRVASTRIQSYAQGTAITSQGLNCVHLYFENVVAVPNLKSSSSTGGAALLIQPSGAGSVLQAVFVGCVFGQTDNDTLYTGPGVLIDQSQTTGAVDQLRFVSCWSSGWPGNGMQINGAVNQVEIIGGCYSCNGQSSDAPAPAIGIDITNPSSGTHAGIRIIGVACNNSVYNNEGGGYLSATQDYGISIASGAKNVFVRHCDLTGNVTAGLQATSPGNTVEVTECSGYNDQATQLSLTAPTTGVTFSATATYGYCGPMAFYVSGGTVQHVRINGNITGLMAGGFTLSPGETGRLDYSATPTYYAVGR